MKAKILLALGTGLAAGLVQAQGIEVKLSGQINRALLWADDGTEQEWFNVDNGNSSTRFRFNAEGDVAPGLKAGILFEAEFKSNPSGDVSFTNRSQNATLNERHMDLFFRGGFGTLRLGQGDGAANGASEVDLSGTTVAHYSSVGDVGGAFQYRTGGAFSGATIGSTLSNQDFESRYDRLHYQTPNFSGFMGEASWGHTASDIVELALRYSAKLDGAGMLAFAIGYSSRDAAPQDVKTLGGSVSWLHGSGLNLTYAHTSRELAGGGDGTFNYFKVGYKVGQHAFSFDYALGDDQAVGGDEAKMFGLGYVFTPVAWAEVFALLKQHSLDRSGVDTDDIQFLMLGSRIKF